jgi:hypothetical protein
MDSSEINNIKLAGKGYRRVLELMSDLLSVDMYF